MVLQLATVWRRSASAALTVTVTVAFLAPVHTPADTRRHQPGI